MLMVPRERRRLGFVCVPRDGWLRVNPIEKRGSPRAVLLSIRDYVRHAVPEPEVLRVIGKEFHPEAYK
jgi:hypothetical protein